MNSRLTRRGFLGAAGASVTSLGLAPAPAGAAGAAAGKRSGSPEWRVRPDDSRYDTLRQGFNQRWSSRPRYIQLIDDDRAAVDTLREAIAGGLRPTVRGGGHCYEDFVDNTGGVILDLSLMTGVREGRDKYGDDTFVVEGGATNWDVCTTLFRQYGRAVPAGSCYSVGAGGHICGGGYGLLSRRDGLTVDHLVQVDLVTARGGRAEVTEAHREDKDPDSRLLFWAHTGGGGGNFGVILRYHFSARTLPAPPPRVWLSNVAWPWETLDRTNFTRLLTNYGDFLARHSGPDESVYPGLFSLLKLTHHSNGNVVLTTQWDGDDPAPLDEFLCAVESGMTVPSTVQRFSAGGLFLPYPDKRRQMPWFQATMTLNPSGDNQRGKYKSAYHRKPFSDEHIAAFWTWLNTDVPGADLTNTLVQIDSYGCRINARGPGATAVPQRDSIMKLQYQTYWTNPAEDQLHLDYLRGFYTDVYRATGGVPEISDLEHDRDTDGAYVNYPDVDLGTTSDPDPAYPRLYYKQNYRRLQDAKRIWDDAELFHHKQSIRPRS